MGRGKLYIGTSGWSYSDWEESFYPDDLAKSKQLEHFASRFKTVEINSSFYHLPRKSTFLNWYQKTPKDFLFAVKISRYISHIKRLKNCKKEWFLLYQRAKILKEKLGPFLIQLPPSFKKDLKTLKEFIKMTKDISLKEKLAFEFRDKSWFSSDVYQYFQKKKNISFCIAHSQKWPIVFKNYGDFSYVRFHGPENLYASSYSEKELKEWGKLIKRFLSRGLDVFCYFNNDFSGFAIQNAKTLINILNKPENHSP